MNTPPQPPTARLSRFAIHYESVPGELALIEVTVIYTRDVGEQVAERIREGIRRVIARAADRLDADTLIEAESNPSGFAIPPKGASN